MLNFKSKSKLIQEVINSLGEYEFYCISLTRCIQLQGRYNSEVVKILMGKFNAKVKVTNFGYAQANILLEGEEIEITLT